MSRRLVTGWAIAAAAGCATASAKPPALAATTPATPVAMEPSGAPACLANALPALRGIGPWQDCETGSGPEACGKRCDAGDADACWELAAVLVSRPETREQAEPLFQRACTLGHGNACTNHAAWLWTQSSDDEPQYECARRVFEKACALDDHFACGMDGRLRLDRRQGDDVERGRAVLERSCLALRGFPCRIIALNLERGVLEPSSPELIRSLMALACAGGDTPACGELETVEGTFEGP